MAAEVVTSTVDRPGSTSIKVDAGITYRAKETDMVISIAVARTTGAEPAGAGTETRSGTWFLCEGQGQLPSPANPQYRQSQ